MRLLPFASLLVLGCLVACNKGVDVDHNLDGSKTVKVETEDGTVTATSKDNETHYKDDKGNVVDTKVDDDGTTTISGKTADGKEFTSQTGKKIDLAIYGLKPYPNITDNGSDNYSSESEMDGKKVMQLAFNTADSPKDVIAFYAPMITGEKSESHNPTGSVIGGKTAKGAQVAVIATAADGKTTVSITGSVE